MRKPTRHRGVDSTAQTWNWFRRIAPWLAAVVALPGCGSSFQAGWVDHHFESSFGCANASLHWVSGGWHVEGCGRRAEYACVRDRSSAVYTKDVAAAVVADALFSPLDETCFLTHSEMTPLIAPQPAERAAHVEQLTRAAGGPAIETRVAIVGGVLRAIARPTLHLHRVLLWLQFDEAMGETACEAQLSQGLAPLPIEQQERSGARGMQLVVSVDDLFRAAQAPSVTGSVCGIPVALDADARAQLAQFAVRVRAMRERILHPPKTLGIAEAREAYSSGKPVPR